jgi:hypothetical protein
MAEEPIDRRVGVHHEARDISGRNSVQIDHPDRSEVIAPQVNMGHFGHPDLHVTFSYYNYTDQGLYVTDRLGSVTYLPIRGGRWQGRQCFLIEIQYTLTAKAEFDPNYLIDLGTQGTLMEKALRELRDDLHRQYHQGPNHIGPIRRSVTLRMEISQTSMEKAGGVLYLRDLDLQAVLKSAYEEPSDTLHPYARQTGPWAVQNRHRQFDEKLREFSILYVNNQPGNRQQGFWINLTGEPVYVAAEVSDFLHTGVYICTSLGDPPQNARRYKSNVYYYPDVESARADYSLYATEEEAWFHGDPIKAREQRQKEREFETRWEELRHREEKNRQEQEQQRRSNRHKTIREIIAIGTAVIGFAAAIAKKK